MILLGIHSEKLPEMGQIFFCVSVCCGIKWNHKMRKMAQLRWETKEVAVLRLDGRNCSHSKVDCCRHFCYIPMRASLKNLWFGTKPHIGKKYSRLIVVGEVFWKERHGRQISCWWLEPCSCSGEWQSRSSNPSGKMVLTIRAKSKYPFLVRSNKYNFFWYFWSWSRKACWHITKLKHSCSKARGIPVLPDLKKGSKTQHHSQIGELNPKNNQPVVDNSCGLEWKN